ncbi:sensor domain-containing diguanylate cyclase [Rhizorhabdus dicambivorans]|uniref:diguanylate cyclase n=1 Tax=Rhizorhabdus dicambivorans TaxID=1850238 RepID=A0A2A4FT95_9SPHN|nr:sensor domain-containing diguanylate cyclase [Rhizorhabdus dicambivorans]ATE64319.1 sensor domain-containing diguanylate cyclase [Rhizorhabdus dicambivorans]PCE40914.1 sensor domain-containing diguanylate cyclase [Rhizorhabdus dicambivorans]
MERLIGNREHRDILAALAGGAGYFLLAWGTIRLTSDGHNVAAIWPANALLLAIVLPIPVRRWPIYFAAALAGNILANYIAFGSLVAPILYGANNLSEVLIAGMLLRRLDAHGNPLENVRSIARFALFACLAPAISAAAGAATAHFVYGQPYWISYRIWYLADALGLLIFTPLFLGVRSGEMASWLREIGRAGRIEVLAIFGLVILAALFVFRSSGYPMLFVMSAPILLASFRLGPFGTKISLIIVAVVGMVCTMSGTGPIAALIPDRGDQALFMQFYLGVMLLSTLPVAAELNARRSLARRLAESEASLRLLASESADALVRLDERTRCIQSSGATTMLLGVESRELVGSPLSGLIDPRDAAYIDRAFEQALIHPGTVAYCEFRPRDREGDWLECTLRALVDQEGRAYGAIGAIRDITIRKEREVSLALAASSDSLTGALNHAAFMAHLDRALAHLTSTHLALIMVDVDHFKQVNDRHGHLAGDRVLVELHARLRALLRDHDVIGRLGGDELAILLDGTAEELAISIAESIRIAISNRPILQGDDEAPLLISVSCGAAQAYPGIGREELMRKADEALYQAKRGGRDRVVISAE